MHDTLLSGPSSQALLTTLRLTLRPLEAGDATALHALLGQPGVYRYLCDGCAPSRGETDDMLANSQRLHAQTRTGLWAMASKALPDEFAGIIGYWMAGEAATQHELLFALDEAYWGRGLATEAGTAMLTYARTALGWHEVRASTDLGNNASIRTLWRLDFSEISVARSPTGLLLRRFVRVL